MRKIKEVLRLKFECGLSERQIAHSCQISRTTVTDYLRRAAISKLKWPEADALGEVQLVERLFPPTATLNQAYGVGDTPPLI